MLQCGQAHIEADAQGFAGYSLKVIAGYLFRRAGFRISTRPSAFFSLDIRLPPSSRFPHTTTPLSQPLPAPYTRFFIFPIVCSRHAHDSCWIPHPFLFLPPQPLYSTIEPLSDLVIFSLVPALLLFFFRLRNGMCTRTVINPHLFTRDAQQYNHCFLDPFSGSSRHRSTELTHTPPMILYYKLKRTSVAWHLVPGVQGLKVNFHPP